MMCCTPARLISFAERCAPRVSPACSKIKCTGEGVQNHASVMVTMFGCLQVLNKINSCMALSEKTSCRKVLQTKWQPSAKRVTLCTVPAEPSPQTSLERSYCLLNSSAVREPVPMLRCSAAHASQGSNAASVALSCSCVSDGGRGAASASASCRNFSLEVLPADRALCPRAPVERAETTRDAHLCPFLWNCVQMCRCLLGTHADCCNVRTFNAHYCSSPRCMCFQCSVFQCSNLPAQCVSMQQLSMVQLSMQHLSMQQLQIEERSMQQPSMHVLSMQSVSMQKLSMQQLSMRPLSMQQLSMRQLSIEELSMQQLSMYVPAKQSVLKQNALQHHVQATIKALFSKLNTLMPGKRWWSK